MVPIEEKDGRTKQTILGDIAVFLAPDDPGVSKDDKDVVFGCVAMLEIVLYLLEIDEPVSVSGDIDHCSFLR
jgi:hypothetical protein